MDKIVITGGCGFIGSHLTDFLFKKFRQSQFIIIDKLTYAANKKYLKKINNDKRVKIVVGDINNSNLLLKLTFKTDLLIHLAAESHVDRSFTSIKKFISTNVQGTRNVLDACRINKVKRIIHVSTDEVYGEQRADQEAMDEEQVLEPTNPYAATKAGAEFLVKSYQRSFGMPCLITRC